MKLKKLFTLLICTLSVSASMKAQTALDIAGEMIPGINLGNTLEACPCSWLSNKLDWETAWQKVKTTQKVIDGFRDQGFKTVRIPCSWHEHMSKTNVIDKTWMDRIQTVVDYCIKDSLYVVLNDHWDNGWLERSFDNLSESNITAKSDTLKTIWTQIATRFKDYDRHLLFAGLNEPAAGVDTKKIAALIRYEQTFIDAVRAVGGNNATRILVVQGPDTNIEYTSSYFDITKFNDTTSDALMVEVHFYGPYNFVMMSQDESWGNMFYYWGSANHVSGSTHNATWGEESWVLEQFNLMKNKFANNGIPVLLGEYSAEWRKMPSGEDQDKHNASIKLWYKTVTKYAITCGCVPVTWDTGGDRGLINRAKCTVTNQYAMDGINEGLASAKWNYASGIESVTYDRPFNANAPMYNLQGVRVDENYHGIYIKNGKKFISK